MICGEHGCPEDQCTEFKHVADAPDATTRAFVKGWARGIELTLEAGVPFELRQQEICALLLFIRVRL